jgi:hypothetical protein
MRGQAGFWDVDERYARLSEAGDPLEKLNGLVPWEVFHKPLAKALKRSDGARGGRPPYDPVVMFKIMVLQALYGLSDDQAQFKIQDRLSFMRFLGLGLADKVPDAKTIWLFRVKRSNLAGARHRRQARGHAVQSSDRRRCFILEPENLMKIKRFHTRLGADERSSSASGPPSR